MQGYWRFVLSYFVQTSFVLKSDNGVVTYDNLAQRGCQIGNRYVSLAKSWSPLNSCPKESYGERTEIFRWGNLNSVTVVVFQATNLGWFYPVSLCANGTILIQKNLTQYRIDYGMQNTWY